MSHYRVRVRIIYKSGATIDVECEKFKVTRGAVGGDLREIEWQGAHPDPLHAGVGEIAAIWDFGEIKGAPEPRSGEERT